MKQIKKITLEEAEALVEKERSGVTLTEEENLQVMLTHGATEEDINLAKIVTSPEYKKPDKDGIITII